MIIRTAVDLGAVIHDARRSRNWSQAELAKRVGLHQPKISEIERGRSGVTVETIFKVLSALELSVNIGDAVNADQLPTIVDPDEPDHDDDFDLNAIARTGIKE